MTVMKGDNTAIGNYVIVIDWLSSNAVNNWFIYCKNSKTVIWTSMETVKLALTATCALEYAVRTVTAVKYES